MNVPTTAALSVEEKPSSDDKRSPGGGCAMPSRARGRREPGNWWCRRRWTPRCGWPCRTPCGSPRQPEGKRESTWLKKNTQSFHQNMARGNTCIITSGLFVASKK
jgi:hypothetical protein